MTNSDSPIGSRDGTASKRQKRTRAACTNCRRKKVRCTAERPACALCTRTSQGQDCVYDTDENLAIQRDVFHGASHDGSFRPDMHNDVLVLLRDIGQRLSHLESAVSSLTGSDESPKPNSNKRQRIQSEIALDCPDSPPVSTDKEAADAPPLPTQRLLTEAANVYAQYSHNHPYAIFNVQTLRQHPERLPLYLQFALIATAVRFCTLWINDDECVRNSPETTARYAQAAWRNISMPWSSHDDSVVFPIIQAIHLLSVIDYTNGNCSTAWVKLGMAIRLAHHMRLHVESTKPTLTPTHQEERRRVFWSLYILDRLISCSKERPPAITDEDCKIFLPCNEDDFRSGVDPTSRETLDEVVEEPIPETLKSNYFALLIIITATLGRIAQYVLQDHKYGNQPVPWSSESRHAKLDAFLLELEGCLGPVDLAKVNTSSETFSARSSGHGLYSQNVFHLCYCLLYHPFLLHQRLSRLRKSAPLSFVERIVNLGQIHAVAITGQNTQLRHSGITMPSFYAYCQTVAWSIHALGCEVGNPALDVLTSRSTDYEDSLANLQYMAQYWPSAGRMLKRIEKAQSALGGLGGFNINSGQTNQDSDEAQALWDVVDYTSMSTITPTAPTAPGSPQTKDDGSFNVTDGLDPYVLDLLSQQPVLDSAFWDTMDSFRLPS